MLVFYPWVNFTSQYWAVCGYASFTLTWIDSIDSLSRNVPHIFETLIQLLSWRVHREMLIDMIEEDWIWRVLEIRLRNS